MKNYCQHCGQVIREAYEEKMTKHKLNMLQEAARQIIAKHVNEFDIRKVRDEYNNYNNFQKLRYHGLVHHVVDSNGNKKYGFWLITRNGWAFLRGEIEIPRWVRVRDNHIVERAPDTIHVKDVYRGAEIITTTFEYFDNDGNSVGYRPVAKPKMSINQMSLIN